MYYVKAYNNQGETRQVKAYSYARAKAAALRLCRLLAPVGGYRGYRAMAVIRTDEGEHIETVRL